MKKFLVLALLWPIVLGAQTTETVFPGLSGQELLDSVVSRYKPIVVNTYGDARDSLYAKVLAIDDDSLRCIYTGYTLYLDPTADPTEYVYQNGLSTGMNTEHVYPRSKGASKGNPYSDMHHLRPAKINVNADRGNDPFGEIDDNLTDKWYYKAFSQSVIPTQNIDAWSEKGEGLFEPRESVKGDIARCVLYFYTMYKTEADLADPDYFELMRPTLCEWNEADPADSAEIVRTWRIAPYQEDKPNPFILDCTLAYRTHCPEVYPACLPVKSNGKEPVDSLKMKMYPNPAGDFGWLEIQSSQSSQVVFSIYNAFGTVFGTWNMGRVEAGTTRLLIPLHSVPCGVYLLDATFRTDQETYSRTTRIVKG